MKSACITSRFISWVVLVYLSVVSSSFSSEKITFYHYDLLGSPVAATNEKGEVLWREEYSPYGNKLLNQDAMSDNARGYTGHVHDAETGLTYMQARYYDPEIGRLMSIDPVEFKVDNPVSFNRYAYGNNNPYKYTDPNGKYAELGIEMVSISLGISSLVNNIDEGNYQDAIIDGLGILGDIVGAATPGAPGIIGLGISASRNGKKAVATASQMQSRLEKGQIPKKAKIDRFDKASKDNPKSKDHVHFKDGTVMNVDGSISHASRGKPNPNKAARKAFRKGGWADSPSSSKGSKSDAPDTESDDI